MQNTHSRYILKFIESLALTRNKMAFISGPRQVGKTTLGKQLIGQSDRGQYWNWDELEFRKLWVKSPSKSLFHSKTQSLAHLVVYDEIHKAKNWKRTLKGIFDTLETPMQIVVTGSARLNVYKKGGDSLMGRYLHFRLHPFSLGELTGHFATDPAQAIYEIFDDQNSLLENKNLSDATCESNFHRLLQFGGFPEPFFEADEEISRIWQRGRIEKIVREDLRDLSRLPELSQIEMLIALLEEKVGGLFTLASLREDLEVAHTTVQRWLNYLNQLYYCYEIKPYSKFLVRSLKKEGKLFLWNWVEVHNASNRFENLIAGHLLKACHFWTDIGKGNFSLQFLRDKEKNEIDFLITLDKKPWLAVEAKLADTNWSPAFLAFRKRIQIPFSVQVTKNVCEKKIWKDRYGQCGIMSACDFLKHLP